MDEIIKKAQVGTLLQIAGSNTLLWKKKINSCLLRMQSRIRMDLVYIQNINNKTSIALLTILRDSDNIQEWLKIQCGLAAGNGLHRRLRDRD